MFCDRGANVLLEPSDVDAALDATRPGGTCTCPAYVLLRPGLRAGGSARAAGGPRAGPDDQRRRRVGRAAARGSGRRSGPGYADADLLFANLDEAQVARRPGAATAAELAAALLARTRRGAW